jgi:hypothetical protein
MQRRRVFSLIAAATVSGQRSIFAEGQQKTNEAHVEWVTQVLERMQTIKPGGTRQALLTVFTTEGGLSTGLQRTFVSRDCPYFKVDVQFRPVGRPERDESGRVTLVEGENDIIVKLSPFYLQFGIYD